MKRAMLLVLLSVIVILSGCDLFSSGEVRVLFHGHESSLPGRAFMHHEGDTLTIPDDITPERYGYLFQGWSIIEEGNETVYQGGDIIRLNGSIDFYPVWEPVTVTITLDPLEGNISGDRVLNIPFGTVYGQLPSASTEQEHRLFNGWGVTFTDIVTAAENHTLTARWADTRYLNETPHRFDMSYAPASRFPTGIYDAGIQEVDLGFLIAQTPVTASLWIHVRDWALDNGYNFVNTGNGTSTLPIHRISWRDAVIWCNALSEMTGLDPVYTYRGRVIKDADDTIACDNAVQRDTNGFRLPTTWEWELAARWRGENSFRAIEYPEGSNTYWNPGRNASGEVNYVSLAFLEEMNTYIFYLTTGHIEAEFERPDERNVPLQTIAWLAENTGFTPKPVAMKAPNDLSLYDMSGNVWEWTFTRVGFSTAREIRGGCFRSPLEHAPVGFRHGVVSNFADFSVGFRVVRNP